jgi:O-methyltransferase
LTRADGSGVVRDLARDFDGRFASLLEQVKPYTMTSAERIYALYEATRYVCHNRIPGEIVECGVWRGGSAMTAAHALLDAGDTERELFLFDTFSGFETAPPGPLDRRYDDRTASELMEHTDEFAHCVAGIDGVRRALARVPYPRERFHLIQGRVEDTVPDQAPETIALLRLDTDWYESTRHELVHLYPRLSPGGVLIVDDYGYWKGARKATDEYLRERELPLLLHRVDETARVAVVPGLPR